VAEAVLTELWEQKQCPRRELSCWIPICPDEMMICSWVFPIKSSDKKVTRFAGEVGLDTSGYESYDKLI
jgi:hypothetical protein